MKKLVLLIIVFAAAAFLAYKLLSDKGSQTTSPKEQPLSIGKNSGVFNTAFTLFLNDYFSLKDALVQWDSVAADQAAYALAAKADSLPLKQLKADSVVILTAQSLAASVSSEAKGFLGESGLEPKRRAFNMLSDEIYSLINTVRYDGETIYHMRCPMAFNDSEQAFWLSNTSKIVNPYLGVKHPVFKNKMVGCGEIVDSSVASHSGL
ncbi:MAG TPA: DUF3347 domain-containing protein [Puia sp.]|jgi:hypothetical protein